MTFHTREDNVDSRYYFSAYRSTHASVSSTSCEVYALSAFRVFPLSGQAIIRTLPGSFLTPVSPQRESSDS